MSRNLLLPIFACLLMASLPGYSDVATVQLKCTADTNISSYPAEVDLNYGASSGIRIKGHEMFMLAKFDVAQVRDWRITGASLFLHTIGSHKLRTMSVSTIAADWIEGDGNAQKQGGGATFTWAVFGKKRWGGRQSDLTDATFTEAGTRCHYADIKVHENGWIELEVPGDFVYELTDGTSYGLVIADEKGQTTWNNDVHSREQSGYAPYLAVTGEPGKRTAKIAVPKPPAPQLHVPASTFTLPEVPTPNAQPAVPLQNSHMRVWAYGDLEKVNPVTGNRLEDRGGADMSLMNTVYNRSGVTLRAASNEFVAFQLCVEAVGDHLDSTNVKISPLRGPSGSTISSSSAAIYKEWYVKDGEWWSEAALPLNEPFSIPEPKNKIDGQRNQSLYIDVYVPHGAAPGTYRGEVVVTPSGDTALRLPLQLTVYSFTLPDTLSFDVDLNAYGPPGDAATELKFHRMAHEHRATLNILGYSQSGTANPDYVPVLEGSGSAIHVKDWSAFDARFGPYFDGTAFADLPRKRIPLSHSYLPFCEGWPSSIKQHYHYLPTTTAYPDIIVEHAMKAPPIDQAFDESFREEFKAVVGDFARHFRDKRWNKTSFQFYMNDKYYFRDPKEGGRGSSWWLLDEPMHRDDWMALRFFGTLFKTALKQAIPVSGPNDPHMIFRADVSRPQWQRDWLNGLVDLMCSSSELFNKNERCMKMKREQGITFWHYGTGNDIRDSNLTEEAWALKAYLAGGDAILPWNSLGGDGSYDAPTPTTLLYPGGRFGIDGPVASLRLKAMRRGQQDVEYLTLLSKKAGGRDKIITAIGNVLNLKGGTVSRFVDDAGKPAFENLTSTQFSKLREAVALELTGGH